MGVIPLEKAKSLLAKISFLKDDESLAINIRLLLSECEELCEDLCHDLGKGDHCSIEEKKKNLAEAKNHSIKNSLAKILIVDDDCDTQRMLRFTLQKRGFNVISKLNPIEAYQELKKINPDIILLDLMMPEMTGFEFLSRLHNSPLKGKIKIIVCSSRNFEKDRISVLEEGANDFISKPYNITELVLKLRSMVS